METYALVNGEKVLTRENITSQTGIPIPQSIKDFLFDGWYNEIKNNAKNNRLTTSLRNNNNHWVPM